MRRTALRALERQLAHPRLAMDADRITEAFDPERGPDRNVRQKALASLRAFRTVPLSSGSIARQLASLDPDREPEAFVRIAAARTLAMSFAGTWPAEAAKVVRDLLVVNAARTTDSTTSHEFVRRLQARLSGAARSGAVQAAATNP